MCSPGYFNFGLLGRRMFLAMIVGCQFSSWEIFEKKVTSNLLALRTIFLEAQRSSGYRYTYIYI